MAKHRSLTFEKDLGLKKVFLSSLLICSALSLSAGSVFAAEVTYTIPDGTTDNLQHWNDENHPLRAQVGDTLIIINGDRHPHQLHTDGAPCAHGDLMRPGESWSCLLTKPYNSREEFKSGRDPIRDHLNYDLKFWLIVE